jgi:hypothetical protein
LDIVVERGLVIEMDKRQRLCEEMLLSLSRTDDGGDWWSLVNDGCWSSKRDASRAR